MGYHFGRYEPPPATPAIPSYLRDAVEFPQALDRGSLHVPKAPAAADRLAELAIVKRASTHRSPEMVKWVEYMDRRGATSMWWGAARETTQRRGLARGLEMRVALGVGQVADVVVSYAQLRKGLPRPFQMDPTIQLLGRVPNSSSFPSGHTRNSYTMARIVARLDPPQVVTAYPRAEQVGLSRMIAGAHVGSDVEAGARLGIAVGDAVVGAVKVARYAVPLAAVVGSAALIAHAVREE